MARYFTEVIFFLTVSEIQHSAKLRHLDEIGSGACDAHLVWYNLLCCHGGTAERQVFLSPAIHGEVEMENVLAGRENILIP